jgi:RNA-directed DNA polymerase
MATNETDKVRQLQRSLYRKAKQEQQAKFYSLYDKLYREDVLWEAWRQVRLNHGAPGIDGESIAEIVENEQAARIIQQLQAQLRAQTYRFDAVRRVDIPKPQGGTRPLEIATLQANCTFPQPLFGKCNYHEPNSPFVRSIGNDP